MKPARSIASRLLIYFISSGCVFFGLLLVIFLVFSGKFAELSLKFSMKGLTEDMAVTLYIDEAGDIKLDDSEVELKWGFDALYSNLAYRLVDIDSRQPVLFSVPEQTQGYLFYGIDLNIPLYHSRVKNRDISLYRMEVVLGQQNYYFDIARSDLLKDLANEAVEATIVDVAIGVILVAFLLFLSVAFIAIRLVVEPANALTAKIKKIKPEDLEKRIEVQDVPKELFPIASAMNDALERVENSFEQQKRFIADAAHELRTPLTIFLNRLELKIPPSPEKDKLINDARYISRIVEQLLDLSRAQNMTGQQPSELMLADVVKNVCSHLAPMAVDKNQALELVDETYACTVLADEGELTVIVKNLLENAIKHTPPGAEIRVTISDRAFSVEDSGKGIANGMQEQIFERFWRENQSDRSGSGLGLAITKELLSHYDATISVSNDSALGGAKFHVEFLNG
ncbi:sensor histidine kinase [Thalassomonas viridans]|uniref:sensor histidine kinase n=1 Tax=Thalassomonas viridans TaxID=137584 RepID=UPI000A8BB21E|nr:HAMP domain-containing sensor histidine kinase [Thalassomonas viridans]